MFKMGIKDRMWKIAEFFQPFFKIDLEDKRFSKFPIIDYHNFDHFGPFYCPTANKFLVERSEGDFYLSHEVAHWIHHMLNPQAWELYFRRKDAKNYCEAVAQHGELIYYDLIEVRKKSSFFVDHAYIDRVARVELEDTGDLDNGDLCTPVNILNVDPEHYKKYLESIKKGFYLRRI